MSATTSMLVCRAGKSGLIVFRIACDEGCNSYISIRSYVVEIYDTADDTMDS